MQIIRDKIARNTADKKQSYGYMFFTTSYQDFKILTIYGNKRNNPKFWVAILRNSHVSNEIWSLSPTMCQVEKDKDPNWVLLPCLVLTSYVTLEIIIIFFHLEDTLASILSNSFTLQMSILSTPEQ